MAASGGAKAGINAKVFRNTGTYGSPTWTEITLAGDVQVAPPWQMSSFQTRETKFVLNAKTLIDLSVTLQVRVDDANAGYQALLAASRSSSSLLDILIVNGALTKEGSSGFRAHFNVNQTGEDQSTGVGALFANFELKPGLSTDGYPKVVTIGEAVSGTPTITYADAA